MTVATCWSTTVTLPRSPYPQQAVEAGLHFDSALPYAVRLVFPPLGRIEAVEWVFGRDLLNEGRHAPVGEGDVTVCPGTAGDILITLRGATGDALISIPAGIVTGFLLDCFALVPAGSEHEHLDLDAALARLCD
ncbi:SsgA family sporulation/cell division regulator [Streptomyces sp. TLI_171]|uniref:SsgA family sporulation/cell division regulator n=1 Tax=Streptomyces sp. TLI_171 TaxID=1938859 RepID=UPI000C1A15AD|nr:SsgA family sporulation/cell division regulator [Streptomyces sp. TLI_171]RKE17432.1 sporulation and cell division protein SsgA [Streptomyces sp. TLI_171]